MEPLKWSKISHPLGDGDLFAGGQRQDVHDHGADQRLLDLFRLTRTLLHPPVLVVHADDQPLVLVAVHALVIRVAEDVPGIRSMCPFL